MISKQWMGRSFWLLAVLLAVASSAPAAEISGKVLLEGPVPEPEVILAKPKPGHSLEGCGHLEKISPKLLVDPEGGVWNAVVWLEGARAVFGRQVAGEFLLDQRACLFEPHVIALPVGGTLRIRNSDPVLHNVRIFQGTTMLMHRWQQADGKEIVWKFDAPGRYLVRCGVHLWMYAWIAVMEEGTLCALTDERGGFRLEGVPPGTYTLGVWHETLGERRIPLEVARDRVEAEPIRYPPYLRENEP